MTLFSLRADKHLVVGDDGALIVFEAATTTHRFEGLRCFFPAFRFESEGLPHLQARGRK